MFNRKPSAEDARLADAIDELFNEIANEEGHTERYNALTDQLSKLMTLRKEKNAKRVSPDTIVIAATNLLGIALIVGHERANVITSKAVNFLMKAH